MKKTFFSLLVLFLLVVKATNLSAVPAYPYQITIKQSDNTLLSLFLKGDEKVNWAKTLDNYTLLVAKNGDYVYAVSDSKGGIKPSEMIAHNEGERSIKELEFISQLDKNLIYSREQVEYLKQFWDFKTTDNFQKALLNAKSTNRELRILVILAAFSDVPFTYDAEYFNALFNQAGYNLNGNEGSVRDYFSASTFGHVTVIADVFGPYTSSAGQSAYGYATVGMNGAKNLLTEMLYLADQDVNYSNYANYGGDYVDCVYMIFAGCSFSNGEPNAIWPHRSGLYPSIQKDGVYIQDYACSSELGGTTLYGTTPPVIGTVCHELSHVLGLADVYDTDYESNGQAFASDGWDIMASGNYNNGGKTPCLWSAFQRSSMGFLDLVELNFSTPIGNKTLPPLTQSNTAYKISHNSTEYFILENRQQEGWDRFLYGHGMLITHIDKSVPGWNYNCANCNSTLLGIDIEEANPQNKYNRPSNTFPGTSNVQSFTDNTNPGSLSNNYATLNKPIFRIKENNTTKNISFDFGVLPADAPQATTNSIIKFTSDSIFVSSTVSQTTDPIVEKGVLYSTSPTPTSNSQKIVSTESTNSFISIISGLQASTSYYVRAYAKNSSSQFFYGEIIQVTTPCSSINIFPYTNSFESTSSLNCWSQEGDSFLSNIWQTKDSTQIGGISSAEEGLKFAHIYSQSASSQTRKLITPPLNLSVLSQPYLKFYFAAKAKGDFQDIFKVYYKTSPTSSWQVLKTYNMINYPQWTKDSIMLPEKSNTYYIAFEGQLYAGYGVCVDNVEIGEANLAAYPSVQTLALDNITDVSIRVSSNLLSQGYTAISEKGIVYGTNPNPTIEDSYLSLGNTLGQYYLTANNLNPNTLYYFRAYAINQGLISYGQVLSSFTKCERINSFPYQFITESTDSNCFVKGEGWELVLQEGVVNPQEGTNFFKHSSNQTIKSKLIVPILNLENHTSTKMKFWYQKPNGNDTLVVLYKIGIEGVWNSLKTYTSSTNLWTLDSIDLPLASDNYYLAFEAVSQNGNTIYLDNIEIDAILQTPIVQSNSATLSSYNSIHIEGEVVYLGLSSVNDRGVCWTTDGSIPDVSDLKLQVGSGIGQFSTTLTNLSPETTYRVRTYATNSYGTSYGRDYIITTPPTPIFNNTITGNQHICYYSVTQNLQGSLPTGGNGQFTYLWLQSPDSLNWELASDPDLRILQSYLSFRAEQTHYYKRIVYSRLVSDTSNIVLIEVSPRTRAGNVFRVQDTIALNDTLKMELRAFVGDKFVWERKKLNFSWEELPLAPDSNWIEDSPAEIGKYFYRVRVTSGVCAEEISGEDWTYVKKDIGLEEIVEDENSIIIYPNPSQGEINIKYNNDEVFVGKLSLYDINSKEIKTVENQVLNKGDNRINLNPIGIGSYLLVLKNKDNVITKILIINK